MKTARVTLTRAQLARVLRRLPAALRGAAGADVRRAMGRAFLTLAHRDCLVKSYGMPGAGGAYWPPPKNKSGRILALTLRLIGSLSPAGHPDQVLRTGTGLVAAGTRVPYAGKHHRGDPRRNLPQRRLWPEPDRLPDGWRADITAPLRTGAAKVLAGLLGVP